jgi:predicted transcriptional regulator of viral defense system
MAEYLQIVRPKVNLWFTCSMSPSPSRPDWRALHRLAYSQGGYFRTAQAAKAGFSNQLLRKHRLAGRLTRPLRGVYRLADVPPGEHDDLIELWLWSEEHGVFSHETALALHGLSDALPSKVHMTLPPTQIRQSGVPRLVVLHVAKVPSDDRTWVGPVPVTTVARTLRDAVDDGVDPALIAQAIADASARKLIDRTNLRGIVPPRQGRAHRRHGVTS